MTQEELRCWAIEQAAKSGVSDILGEAVRIMAFVAAAPPGKRRKYNKWTPECLAMLKQMRAAGERFSAIADAINRTFGCTVTTHSCRTAAAKAGALIENPTALQIQRASRARAAARARKAA